MSKKNIRFLIYCLFAAAIVAVDQWTKYLVVENIPLFSYVGAIPKLFHLTMCKIPALPSPRWRACSGSLCWCLRR